MARKLVKLFSSRAISRFNGIEMTTQSKKSVRKLISLTPDLLERVENFRASSGATSEADALKKLVEDGLKLHDKPENLFQRCETATKTGQSIGEVINQITSDHPLVDHTTVTSEYFFIYLKEAPDSVQQRFRYSRITKNWLWEYFDGYQNDWLPLARREKPAKKSDLDDEIPF